MWDCLLLVGGKERVGVHSVDHRAAEEGEEVEDDWRLVFVLEQELREDIVDDRDDDERDRADSYQHRGAELGELSL
jgi:hypothetical protein